MADLRTLRSFAGLAGGETVARLLAFIATLVVARRLGPELYGVITVASGILLYLTQVADGGIELSGVPVVARRREDLTALVSATLTARIVLAVALSAITAVVGVTLAPQPDGAVLAAYALGLVFVGAGTRWVFLGLQATGWVAFARISGELVALAVVVLAVQGPADLAVVPIATVLGAGVAATAMFGGLGRLGVRPRVSRHWALGREMFERGPRLVGFTLLGLILFNADLIYLRLVSGEREAGLYAAAYTFIAFAANLSVAWAHSVLPAIARSPAGSMERNAVYARALALSFWAAVPLAVGGAVVAAPLMTLVFGEAFGASSGTLVVLLGAVPVAALREVITAGLIASPGGERQLIRINAVSAAMNVAVLVPVVPRFGALGAAAVTVLTELVRLAMALRAARRAGFTGLPWGRFLRPVAAAALMGGGLQLLAGVHVVVQVSAGVLLYTVGLGVTGGLRFRSSPIPRLEI